ncbi:hypothetical protein ES703_56545 [subsurface metagenome]
MVTEKQQHAVAVRGPHLIAAASGQINGLCPDFFAANGIERNNDSHVGVIVGQAPFVGLVLK